MHTLHNADPCARTEFTIFNPIVVDSNYVEWYSATIPPAFIPATPELSESQRESLMAAFIPDYVILTPPPATPAAPAGSCTWPETEAKIRENFPDDKLNIAFFFIRNEEGNAIWAQFYVQSNNAGEVLLTPFMGGILQALDCLYPRPDLLYTIVLGPTNQTLIFGYVPRTSDQTGIEGSSVNGFDPQNEYRYVLNP